LLPFLFLWMLLLLVAFMTAFLSLYPLLVPRWYLQLLSELLLGGNFHCGSAWLEFGIGFWFGFGSAWLIVRACVGLTSFWDEGWWELSSRDCRLTVVCSIVLVLIATYRCLVCLRRKSDLRGSTIPFVTTFKKFL